MRIPEILVICLPSKKDGRLALATIFNDSRDIGVSFAASQSTHGKLSILSCDWAFLSDGALVGCRGDPVMTAHLCYLAGWQYVCR
jgi:hypothetical protein